jgi:hypothetical protein
MLSNIFHSPKTTAAGVIFGLLPVLQMVYGWLEKGQTINWNLIWIAAGIAVLGAIAKDWNVTGTPGGAK